VGATGKWPYAAPVNPDIVAAVDRLGEEGVLTPAQTRLFSCVARRELVSARIEVRAALYMGVLLLTGGVALFVKENHERIGPAAIALAIFALAAGCLVWAWRNSPATHAGFDYVLLLGALLVATDLAFLETQLKLLGENWPWHLLAVAVLYGLLAYRFDSRMLLSLSLASFAAWRGLSVNIARASLGGGDTARLRVEALACGVLFVLAGVVLRRAGRKAHFEDVYVSAGLLLGFGGLLSGVFTTLNWPAWTLALIIVAGATAFIAFRTGRTLPFALAVVATWLGLQRWIFEGARMDPSAALLLSAASAAAALIFIVFARRRMRIP